MLTKEVSQKFFNNALTSIHAKRANCLFQVSWALLNEAKLTVSSLGQHKDGTAYVKHKIKSVDRLIGNSKLHEEIPVIYKEFFQFIIASKPILYILVDWSGCCRKDIYMLRASIVHDGRSITIYNEVHSQKKYGNRQVHNNFLARLKKMIPEVNKVVIITDAGFATPWFKSVLKLGWDYIGRLASYTQIRLENNKEWIKVSSIHETKSYCVKSFGKAMIGKSSNTPVYGNIYRYKEKCKKRKGRSKYPKHNKSFSEIYKTSWILATSLKKEEHSGDFVKNTYKNRMQVEQNFRDEKSARFGFGWRLGRTNCMKRLAVLCLIAHIAAFFLLTLGVMAEKLGLHKKFQVNTENRRVLSLLTLGKQIIKHTIQRNLNDEFKNCLDLFITNQQESIVC